MDVTGYRNSGELSDITVVIDGEEFNLHKFPLFVRSYFFKNLTLDSKTSRVELNNFPGGPKTFAIIADYCYNKQVNIDQENVVDVRCAAEYLKMTVSGSGCSGLALLAENIIFDLTYSAKSKKDYKSVLGLLKKSIEYADLAEKCSINRKIIDSFVENLAIYVKSNNLYDSIGLYDKSPSLFAPKKSLHDLSLNHEQISIINSLPLKWMNDLIRSSVRFNLNPSLLSHLIQNYIDFNTDLNPHYNELLNEKNRSRNSSTTSNSSNQSNKVPNLIKMASDILKAEGRLESVAKLEEEKSEVETKNLDEILINENDNLAPKSLNLIKIANDILKVEDNLAELVKSEEAEVESAANEENNNESSSDDSNNDENINLIQIASSILKAESKLEEKLNVDDSGNDSDEKDAKSNLVKIAGDILLAEEDTSNENESKPTNLINIANAILNTNANETSLSKPQLSNEDKLKLISSLANSIVELRFDAKFPISWLLFYLNKLNELNAESSVKAIFNRWTWNAINDLKSNSRELSAIPPPVMIKMVQDISAYDGISHNEYEKLIDLTDRYINDLNSENKLNSDLLIQLLSSIPKSKRQNFDSITTLVVDIFNKDENIDSEMQAKLIGLIDFEKINEKTLKICKNSPHIPPQCVSEAALALCFKLRDELEDAKLTIKSFEIKNSLAKTAEKAVYSSTSYASKYTKPTSTTTNSNSTTSAAAATRIRNRSMEPKMNTNSRYNEPSRLNQSNSYNTTFASKNLPSYSTTTSTSNTSCNYHSNYSTSLSREPRFTSPMTTGLTNVLNTTYKSSNYNPSPTNTNSYLNSNSYHSNLDYYDYLADEYSYDYGDCSQNYFDDEDYYCSSHNYPYYSRIY